MNNSNPSIDPQGGSLIWDTEYHDVKVRCFYNTYAQGIGIVSVYCNGADITALVQGAIIALWEEEIEEYYIQGAQP